MIKLLPCPFCGGEAEFDAMRPFCKLSDGKRSDAVAIYCTKCHADMSICRDDHPEYEANDILTILVDAWNIRIT